MPASGSMRVSAARLCAFNAGIQLVWGAILAVELQARIIKLLPDSASAVSKYTLIAAAGAAVATVVQLLAGIFSDRLRARGTSRQIFYAIGVAFSIPAIVWLLLANTLAGIAAAFVLLEITMNIAGGPYQAIIPEFVEVERRGLASSWMSAYQSIGNAIGLLVAALVADLRIVAGGLVVPLLAAYAVSASYARTLQPTPITSQNAARPTQALFALLLSRGLINIGFFTLLGFLAFYVHDSLGSADVKQTGFIFLAFTLSGILGAAVSSRFTDRFDKRAVISISVGIIALALAILVFASSFAIAYAGATIAGFAWGAFATADWALATTTLAESSMATSMGVWNIATTIPQVIAPLGTGPIVVAISAHHAGMGPRAAIALALVEFVLGGIAIWLVPAPKRLPAQSIAPVEELHDTLGDDRSRVGMA